MFRETIESIPAMAFVSRADGYRTFVNKGWVEFTGMTVEQSLGSGWHAAIHPEDLKRVLDKWEEALATGEPMYYEARYRRAQDGQYRWFMARVVAQRDKRGKVVKWFGTVTDIEDRKRAEDALQRSQFYIGEGQRVANMGSWAFNAAGFEYWSPELFRIHGLDPSGKPPTVEEYLALVHPEDREFMKQGIAKMLMTILLSTLQNELCGLTKRFVTYDVWVLQSYKGGLSRVSLGPGWMSLSKSD